MHITAHIGDITNVDSRAIVNAACLSLEGGGGVDGAVHRAAGPELLKACKALPEVSPGIRCPTGEVRVTLAFDLPNHYIIHTVGPRYEEDRGNEASKLLRNCYYNSIWKAYGFGCTSIAFPAISTGIFGYPLEAATIIAVKTVMETKRTLPKDFSVTFVCFDEANFLVYKRVIDAARNGWAIDLVV